MPSDEIDFCDLVEEQLLAKQIEFLTTRSPDDFHRFAENVNWDGSLEGLYWIVSHPDCDRATAALIFWKGEPTFYSYEDCTEKMGDRTYAVEPMLKYISERFNTTGYNRAEIAFSYAEGMGLCPDYDQAELSRSVPISDALELAERQRGHLNPNVKIHPDLMRQHLPGRRVLSPFNGNEYYQLVPTYEQVEEELIVKLGLGDDDPYDLPPLKRSELIGVI